MRKVVVTPAGRKRYLELLLEHMQREYNTDAFAQWDLWLNTNVAEDIDYCRSLASQYSWIKIVEVPDINSVNNRNIYKFFKYACDPETVYVRLDDDIVYVEPGFFDKIYHFRITNPEPFLIYGNIINNAIISHIHQRNGLFTYNKLGGYKCMDDVGWKDHLYAETVHRAFLQDLKEGNISKWHKSFGTWTCFDYERVSINCIAWLGKTFKEFEGDVGVDEEAWLSVDKPKMMSKPNVIFGDAIVAHFSFFTQRSHLDNTDLLQKYKECLNLSPRKDQVVNTEALKSTKQVKQVKQVKQTLQACAETIASLGKLQKELLNYDDDDL